MFQINILPFASIAFQAGNGQQERSSGSAWWLWLLLILIVAVILWLVFRRRNQAGSEPSGRAAETAQFDESEIDTPAAPVRVKATVLEDDGAVPAAEALQEAEWEPELPDEAEAEPAAAAESAAVSSDVPAEEAPAGSAPVSDDVPLDETEAEPAAAEETPAFSEQPAAEEDAPASPAASDKLTKIEGIGPKIQSVLNAAGIHTFAQLRDMDPEKIREILTDSGIRLADPTTWPEQARLASLGKTDELKAYQDTLKGGRAV